MCSDLLCKDSENVLNKQAWSISFSSPGRREQGAEVSTVLSSKHSVLSAAPLPSAAQPKRGLAKKGDCSQTQFQIVFLQWEAVWIIELKTWARHSCLQSVTLTVEIKKKTDTEKNLDRSTFNLFLSGSNNWTNSCLHMNPGREVFSQIKQRKNIIIFHCKY